MKIYICHYKPLFQRKIYIKDMMKKMKLNFEFITDYDREEINGYLNKYQLNKTEWNKQIKVMKPIFSKSKNNHNENKKGSNFRKLIRPFLNKIYLSLALKPRKLSSAEISNSLKHLYALRQIKLLKTPALVLEDDVIAKENTVEFIEQALELCSKSFDYVDLGGGCDLTPHIDELPIDSYENFLSLSIPRTRTTAGYMISPKAASILSEEMVPFIMPTGWQFNYLFLKHSFKVAWSEPAAFIHGSLSETYNSSIQGI